MGWFGYGIYDGDDTQTQHMSFIKQAIPSLDKEEIFEFLLSKKTKIPQKYVHSFQKGIPNVLKKIKIPKNVFKWDEDNAMSWHMLLSLFINNNINPPDNVMLYGVLATYYLMNFSKDFDKPSKRSAALRNFIKKKLKNFNH